MKYKKLIYSIIFKKNIKLNKMRNKNLKEILCIDSSGDMGHQLIFSFWSNDLDALKNSENNFIFKQNFKKLKVYCTIHLNPLPWYKRIINGIKYIFGYKSIYGDFEEFIFDPRDGYKLYKIANFLQKAEYIYEKNNNKNLNNQDLKKYINSLHNETN